MPRGAKTAGTKGKKQSEGPIDRIVKWFGAKSDEQDATARTKPESNDIAGDSMTSGGSRGGRASRGRKARKGRTSKSSATRAGGKSRGKSQSSAKKKPSGNQAAHTRARRSKSTSSARRAGGPSSGT